jgi:hypothetical protein
MLEESKGKQNAAVTTKTNSENQEKKRFSSSPYFFHLSLSLSPSVSLTSSVRA